MIGGSYVLRRVGKGTHVETQRQRVRVREWRRSDSRAMEAWPPFNDPLDQIWNLPRSMSLSREGLFDDWNAERRTWTLETIEGEVIGRISLREIDYETGQARLGISMGAPYVSRGLGTEGLRLFLDQFFGPLGFQTMVLDVAAPNLRAVRCYQRLGFRVVGDEWREVPMTVNLRFLDKPEYSELQRFFRFGRRSVWVQFYEMELPKSAWLTEA
jgi:RimJ/RimL family protein N-acetyltransferase